MATWEEMAVDNRSAAKELSLAGRFRSAVTRSYYAGYCAVASALEGQVNFGYGGNNPAHEQLEPLILNNLYELTKNERQELRKAIRALRRIRVLADYSPAEVIDAVSASDARRDERTIFIILGINTK